MYNEILGYVIIQVDDIILSADNNKRGNGIIKLKKYNNQYFEPDEHEFGKNKKAFIAANNTDFERNKYYLCAYYENKKDNVDQKIFINEFIEQIKPIEITEDEEEYLTKKDIYWDDVDNKIIYKPVNLCNDKYCIEGWENSTIYKYTINESNKLYMLILPLEKPYKFKDYLIEYKNKNKLYEWIIEEIKSYNKEIQNEIEQILKNNIDENIYASRWKKGLEQFRSNILIKTDERKDEIIKIIDEYYYKKSDDIDREISEKQESIKILDSDIKEKQQEKEKVEQNIKRLQSIKIELKKEINEKKEEKKLVLEGVNKEKERLVQENSELWQKNIELKATLEQQQIEYLLQKKDNLINLSIEHKDSSYELQQDDLNKKVIKKYNNMEEVYKHVNEVKYEELIIKHKELVIYPNPKWVSFDDLWSSGFGAIFEMAHENKEELYVVIIQNYNLSPCELWSMPLVNLIYEYTNKLPYTQNIGYPKNLWIYFIESELEEISFPVSEYFNGIFND